MTTTTARVRRGLGAVFAAIAAGGAVVFAMTVQSAPATAAADACAASEVAKTIGSVATSTGAYLDSRPQTNQALTAISQQQAGPQSLAAVKAYFDANPQAAKDMQQLQAPLVTLSAKCRLPLTLPQALGLIQAVQAPGSALPGSLPNPQSSVPAAGVPGAGGRTPSSAATAVTQGAGPLPGPVSTATG